ncbi:MAG: twin-arginine translocase subunit TatC [Chloroflexi bacterium]|nr:twin-arginine translocase subunit TatC [Chloroflexota bacterium]
MGSDRQTTIREHLLELRGRLTVSAIAVAVATAAGFFLTDYVFRALKALAPDVELIFIELPEYIATYFKVSLLIGLGLALPVVVYEMIMFVAPALTPRERRLVLITLPAVFLSFIAGAAFAYFVLLPPALRFLLTFGSDIVKPQIRIGNYVNVVSTLIFWVGLVFEMPLVVALLARLGIVSHRFLWRQQRWALVAAFVLGAFITPTIDPVNQTLVAGPVIILYQLSILLAWLVRKRPHPESAPTPVAEGTP